jgi:hypothetical protein
MCGDAPLGDDRCMHARDNGWIDFQKSRIAGRRRRRRARNESTNRTPWHHGGVKSLAKKKFSSTGKSALVRRELWLSVEFSTNGLPFYFGFGKQQDKNEIGEN